MSKPYIHAQSSCRHHGGKPEDYLAIHNWFDETKAIMADSRHRALRHHAEGIFLCERIFGVTLTNSDGRVVSVRDIAEQHVLEDFGNRFIPSAQDYLQELPIQDWMIAGQGAPPSYAKITPKVMPNIKDLESMMLDGATRGRVLVADGWSLKNRNGFAQIEIDIGPDDKKPSTLKD